LTSFSVISVVRLHC